MGALLGTEGISSRWSQPLHDTLESALEGMNVSRIRDLAERTTQIAGAVLAAG